MQINTSSTLFSRGSELSSLTLPATGTPQIVVPCVFGSSSNIATGRHLDDGSEINSLTRVIPASPAPTIATCLTCFREIQNSLWYSLAPKWNVPSRRISSAQSSTKNARDKSVDRNPVRGNTPAIITVLSVVASTIPSSSCTSTWRNELLN